MAITQQHHEHFTGIIVVHAIARPVVDTQLPNAFAADSVITQIVSGNAIQSTQDYDTRGRVATDERPGESKSQYPVPGPALLCCGIR
jgi:hypothetical protein